MILCWFFSPRTAQASAHAKSRNFKLRLSLQNWGGNLTNRSLVVLVLCLQAGAVGDSDTLEAKVFLVLQFS